MNAAGRPSPARALALLLLIAASFPATALQQTPTLQPEPQPRISRDFQLGAKDTWTTSDLEIRPGERVVLKGTGTGRCAGHNADFGPAGLPRGFRDLLRVLPVQTGLGALLARIGDAGVGLPFAVGESSETVSAAGGVLALGMNWSETDGCTGAFSVHVDVFPPNEHALFVVAERVDALDVVDDALLASLPRRVSDRQGNAGDIANFLMLGSEAAMQRVFKAAGWVIVDADIGGAIVKGVLGSLSKEAYLTLPMSQLYLFGRPQDFGWAHAEPIKVVAARHHLRVWRAPKPAGSTMLWAGAATHDIGFERDQRNNGITHKIDPNVDLEREFVEKSLTRTGFVTRFTYVTPAGAVREARTATGGVIQSDGRILVLELVEEAAAR